MPARSGPVPAPTSYLSRAQPPPAVQRSEPLPSPSLAAPAPSPVRACHEDPSTTCLYSNKIYKHDSRFGSLRQTDDAIDFSYGCFFRRACLFSTVSSRMFVEYLMLSTFGALPASSSRSSSSGLS